jgi:DNA-binding CsgD family transcriptional regulator
MDPSPRSADARAVRLLERDSQLGALAEYARSAIEGQGRLVISTKTVDHHVSAVLGKLGVPSRRAAAAEAHRLGLVPPPR